MQKEANVKLDSLLLKVVIFLAKIPLIILIAGLNTVAKEESKFESVIDRYKQDPSILDGFSSPQHRYPSES